MSNNTQITQIKEMTDIVEVRTAATKLGVSFSGNSGIDTLKDKVIDTIKKASEENETSVGLTEVGLTDTTTQIEYNTQTPDFFNTLDSKDDEIEVAVATPTNHLSIEELLEMDPNEVEDVKIRRQIIRAKAMRLHRVHITNLDPADSSLEGAIITVVNKYIGKVSKFIPFGEAGSNGYHVEEVLLNALRNKKFVIRKEVKSSKFGVKQYKTSMVPKYVIKILPPLTKQEIEGLAQRQAASNAIG